MNQTYTHNGYPKPLGLYDPAYEKDACGVGFVCNINGQKTNKIVAQGLEVLRRLAHRGAVGADPKTGDGAGILLQMPHDFFIHVAKKESIILPANGEYGAGIIFLPTRKNEHKKCKAIINKTVKEHGQVVLGWRRVPVDNKVIGKGARETEPVFEQVFVGMGPGTKDQDEFERKLYIIRKISETKVRSSNLHQKSFFYITNISSRTFSYKGLLMTDQLEDFFTDLKDPLLKSALALVHSRYSTNTFPTWDLAQPFRFLAHNGEINTVRGNINKMRAREGLLESPLFSKDIESIKPVLVPGGSDSATIDNMIELLVLAGRSLPHAMMMLIPGAWEQDKLLHKNIKDFYKYHSCFMEPWDGPAAIAVTDGTRIGAALDRNGLRPARYIVTKDGFVVMSSEAGVLDIDSGRISQSGRLEPGKIFFIDTDKGRIIGDEEVKKDIASQEPYGAWLKKHMIELSDIQTKKTKPPKIKNLMIYQKMFGYSREDIKDIIIPMAEQGKEPTASMGNDTPHSVISKRPQLLYTYFKQLFAQVTNPAVDPIREEIVMSLNSYIGSEKNVLAQSEEHCRKIGIKNPVITDEELAKIKHIKTRGFKSKTISILFDVNKKGAFEKSIDRICEESENAIKNGFTFIVLSDRQVNKKMAALPALIAVGAVHQHLIKKALRTRVGLILESGEPREVHHFAVLFGYGADCVDPYLVYETIRGLVLDKYLKHSFMEARKNYRKALKLGIYKILSKMGISTIQSYRGAQIFEALGVSERVVNKCFSGTASRIGGVDMNIIAKETMIRHNSAYSEDYGKEPFLSTGGLYRWKKDGEFHLWNPESIAAIQDATRNGDYLRYKEFAALINDQSANPTTLRSLLSFKNVKKIPLSEVESEKSILRRFVTGAMSFGSISRGAHETLAYAMNRLGGRSNTGEGGEDPVRFQPLPNGDSARSSIKQVASGRFGVSTNYLINADELQIKIAQGAKPGEGGQLPGHKVSRIIAKTRYTTPGVTLISPPPHHDIYSIEDLAQLIFDLKNVNPKARISVKLVSEVGVGTIAAGVAKGHADMILISGGDGGTGASPASSIKHAGLPWELGLSETHQTLVFNKLRSRVRLQTDGQMRTGRDVAIAAMLGAEEYGFCTAALIVMGCVMLRHCHLNNCSVGVATQDDILQGRFTGRVEHVMNYIKFVTRELREIMADLGVKSLNDLIGRTDLLKVNEGITPWKAKRIDFSKILYKPKVSNRKDCYCTRKQDHKIDNILDKTLIKKCKKAIENKKPVDIKMQIANINRTTGAMLSGKVCSVYGESGLPEDTIRVDFEGIAGQSFGAWLAKGITFRLEGMANDYIGKGISGGKIIVRPSSKATFKSSDNIIIGNTTFYGAISGEAYINGKAGERFCIRNSGLNAVVEGVGDHGCEYMTGGRVVVLGETGRNFAAGMSGGIAYIYGDNVEFAKKCNLNMVQLETVTEKDTEMIYNLLHNHYIYTDSAVAGAVLDNFGESVKHFIKVMPLEYKRILDASDIERKTGVTEVSDG